MRRKFTMMMAVILLLILPLNVLANGEEYPLKTQYSNGVEPADTSLFSNSRIEKPIDTSFEKSSEIKSLIEESQSNQLSVSEDSYSGKFALKIQKDDDKILPVYETDYFATGNKLTSGTVGGDKTVVKEISGIEIVMRDKNVIVSGKAVASEEVSILVKKGQTHAYINQMTADKNGNYAFSFPLMEYGTYQLGVGGSVSETIYGTFELINPELIEDTEITTEETVHPKSSDETYKTKCNYYTLKLKPMNNSESISFYVKVSKFNEFGIFEEDYALIKSDSDEDGVFSVGTDLSRGKWQTVQLNITDLDDEFQNGTAAGLYMKANVGSQWLIDDITSGYKKINETKFNLNEFATGNVVYSENGLQFEKNKSKEEYNISSKVVSGGIKVSEPLTGIQIDSKIQNFLGDSINKEEKTTLYSASLESDNCALNNTDEQILCERVQILKVRGEIPVILSVNTMTISAKPETEKRYRLKIRNISENSIELGITPESGTSKIYYINNTGNTIYTDWYDGDITLSSRIKLNYAIKIEAIEYEPIEDSPEKGVVMSPNGSITMDLGNLTTNDRANIEYELSYENGAATNTELVLELFEGNSSEPYYMTKTYIKIENLKQIFNSIVPKIRANTKLKITYSSPENSQAKIRVSKIDVLNVEQKDWNKSSLYVNNKITGQGTSYSADATYLKKQSVKSICSKTEEYAVLYPDIEGIVNVGTSCSTLEYRHNNPDKTSYTVYRMLNLNNEPVKTFITSSLGTNITGGTPIYLHYGMAEYVVSGRNNYLALPANANVMLISKTCYSEATVVSSPIHYTYVDGLENGYFIQNDTSILFSNVCDNGSAYKYDLEKRISQKLYSDKLISASPDGSHLLLNSNDGKFYILNTRTGEKEYITLPNLSEEYFFNVKNELFVIGSSLYYYNSGAFHELYKNITSKNATAYDFDATGEYLLWIVDNIGKLYKNTNGIWNEVTQFTSVNGPSKAAMSNDISTAYIQRSDNIIYAIDLNTQTNSILHKGEIMGMTDDNMLMIKDSGYYYLYNLVTAEKYKIFNESFECDSMYYNPETNMVTVILPNSRVIYHRFSSDEPEVKYALSFDGSKTWLAYNGGRWQTVSNSTVPASEELKLSGMSENAVNTIPSSAYEKLYSNNTDILTVDVALYMYSDSKNRTPLIESITVESIEKDNLDGLYGIHIEKYNKKDYRKITSLFPVENFGSNAECYYLLYIGNDWLYTYKDNELIKVEKSADALLSNMSESWITFKQYGMTAKELRRISGDVLSQLFVNEDYANTEFGVIYVVKTKNEDTSEYVVNFRLGSSTDFIEEDIVVELTMNGGDVKIIDSTQFSSTDIENLLSWIEARQSGSGEIFYRLKNEKTQHFINYYMINSISVYNGEEYRAKNTAE